MRMVGRFARLRFKSAARVPAAVSQTAPIYTPQRRQIRNSAVPEPKR